MAEKRQRLTASERRMRIVAAARPLFIANGLAATRTRDIAEAAEVNEALIYQHFSSKDELFDAAIVAPLEAIVERLAATTLDVGGDTSGAAQQAAVVVFLKGVLGAMVESMSLFGIVLFSDLESGRAFYGRRVAPLLDELAEMIQSNLAGWPHLEFDPRLVVTAAFGVCWGVALDANYGGRELDVDRVARQLGELLFGGVTGGQGKRARRRPPTSGARAPSR